MLGTALFLMEVVPPQPAVAVVGFGVLALLLAVGAVVLWRRTGMVFATLGFVVGAVGLALFAWLKGRFADAWMAAGLAEAGFPATPVVLVLAALAPTFLFVESRRSPRKWRLWRQRMESVRLVDFLLLRHIPDLRDRQASV